MERPNANGNSKTATNPGIECPLCKIEIDQTLETHLLERHTHEELATLVATYVHEREETGTIL